MAQTTLSLSVLPRLMSYFDDFFKANPKKMRS
jgi:hypothetical protein